MFLSNSSNSDEPGRIDRQEIQACHNRKEEERKAAEHLHEDMDERIESAAEICLAPRCILDNKEPHRKECCCMMVHVKEADLQFHS